MVSRLELGSDPPFGSGRESGRDRVSPIGFTKESSKSQTTYPDATFSHGIIAFCISCIHGCIDIRTFHSCGGLLGLWYPQIP